ncbi:hypothetical protein [Pleionea sp. CnH1-48]|uniref:hypothetical protein n=1 Tax=Pleionea sp. CnH1-48 TaxID=2954494 RepID=UPI0020985D58|nr:hypothetical protein [Pleionea sp. CnH1-48]MCO7226060.1 hypothetical protein [Pleionea sp. CnH1-48]
MLLIRSLIVLLVLLMTSCANLTSVVVSDQVPTLTDNEGLLGLEVNTLDILRQLTLENAENGEQYGVNVIKPGTHNITLKVPAGRYCVVKFNVYDSRYSYDNGGFCTNVEAGKLNYLGHLMVRNPTTYLQNTFPTYIARLGKNQPTLCEHFIGELCALSIIVIN